MNNVTYLDGCELGPKRYHIRTSAGYLMHYQISLFDVINPANVLDIVTFKASNITPR